MKVKDINWIYRDQVEDSLFSFNTEDTKHRLTVLDRLTGYGDGNIRDIETGYKDLVTNQFWLATGNFDIRKFPELTIEEAIQKIKDNADVCKGAIYEKL